jgi:DNA polymerase family B
MRTPDYLGPLKRPPKRRRFLTYDIESKADDGQRAGFLRPFLLGVYDGIDLQVLRDETHLRREGDHLSTCENRSIRPHERSNPCPEGCHWRLRHKRPGGCVDKLMAYVLTEEHSGKLIYAHNGGNFDHLFLLSWLREHRHEYGFEVVPVQSSIQKLAVWRWPEHQDEKVPRWDFIDSMKLFPTSLDKFLKAFGLGGKVDMDLERHEDSEEWLPYVRQDVIGLYQAVEEFHELLENKLGGEVGMTAPATAMKLFRRQHLGRDAGSPKRIPRHRHFRECDCPKDGSYGCLHEWVRRGYYGGRTEVYRVTGEGLHYYDINSSYAASLRKDMPAGDRRIERGEIRWEHLRNNVGFAECSVYVPPDAPVPPLPYRDPVSGKLLFPSGHFDGVWDIDELNLLNEIPGARVESVERVVWFRRKPIFRSMVDKLWTLRDKTLPTFDEALGALAKLMLNSLYGKFGMNEERVEIVFKKEDCPPTQCFLCGKEAKGGLCDGCEGSKPATRDPEEVVWYRRKRMDAPYIIPQIAAHVTADARIRIWRAMMSAIEAGGKLYYTDTDSVITDIILPSSPALGELKDEHPGQLLKGMFLQPKLYLLSCDQWETDKVTAKGFPRQLRTRETFEKLREGAQVDYERIEKIRSLARARFSRPPMMVTVKKSIRSEYDKRVVLDDGSTISRVMGMTLTPEGRWEKPAVAEAAEE